MKSFINSCIEANKEILYYLTTDFKKSDLNYTDVKGEGGDNSLYIDIIIEKIFIDKLSSYGNIYTEERGFINNDFKHKKIIIDPLDGSDNFLSGLEYYGSSIAYEIDGVVKVGIVCNFATGEIIIKDDNKKITIENLFGNDKKRFFTTTNIGIFERAYACPKIAQKLFENKEKFRSPGAVALSLANAKNYRFVLFGGKIRDFDIKAGLYISEELFIYKSNDFLLISKYEKIFNSIKEIIKDI